LPAQRRTDDTLSAWFDLVVNQHAGIAGGFDLLHASFLPQAGFVAAYAGRYLGLPVVVGARGNDLDRAVFDPAKAGHILYALQSASVVTANSRDLQRKAQALAPGQRVFLAPNGVDVQVFRRLPPDQDLVQSLGLAGREVIGFAGEARAKKGLAILLLAAAALAERRSIALLLVGGIRPGDDQALVDVFHKQRPDVPLIIVPNLPHAQMPAYYNLMDVLALPSRRDGLPNALLEGMACECALVATPVGGIPDALQDGVSGRLVPPGDAPALAAAILDLLEHPGLRRSLGKAARQAAGERFPLATELDINLELYHQLLSRAV
jgi:glycosyltransferase involved in cell wall biosynthesis